MRPRHTFQCEECDNQFDKQVKWNQDQVKCTECGGVADRIYLGTRSPHQQFSVPIVMWRYKDGKLGVAGKADASTPKGADRVEISNLGDYRKYVKELNSQHRGEEGRKEERYMQEVERVMGECNRELARLASIETDPMARDILLEGMKWSNDKSPEFREWYSEIMER